MQCDIVKIGNIIRNKVVLMFHEIGYMSPSFLWILFIAYYILMLMLSVQ